jgi:hypothetical protein
MSRLQGDYDDELWNLMTALAESVLDAPDDEIVLEPDQEPPEEIRSVLRSAVARFKTQRLGTARLEYERTVNEARSRVTSWVSRQLNEKRELLVGLIQHRPELQAALTLQFRDFSQLSEEDVDSVLRQLEALGVLDEPGGGRE